jgi:hypothetical protein
MRKVSKTHSFYPLALGPFPDFACPEITFWLYPFWDPSSWNDSWPVLRTWAVHNQLSWSWAMHPFKQIPFNSSSFIHVMMWAFSRFASSPARWNLRLGLWPLNCPNYLELLHSSLPILILAAFFSLGSVHFPHFLVVHSKTFVLHNDYRTTFTRSTVGGRWWDRLWRRDTALGCTTDSGKLWPNLSILDRVRLQEI